MVSGFLRFLAARDCSPNILIAYAYDLRHLWRVFARDLISQLERLTGKTVQPAA
ncbi:hypothetical protein [Nonomuraea sp. NPDC003709]|uniref:hypothetical protein n=1 Tax=Nonomuraea sp. NPDC003709 TaxID=3154450 RepID=UPI00339E0D60